MKERKKFYAFETCKLYMAKYEGSIWTKIISMLWETKAQFIVYVLFLKQLIHEYFEEILNF